MKNQEICSNKEWLQWFSEKHSMYKDKILYMFLRSGWNWILVMLLLLMPNRQRIACEEQGNDVLQGFSRLSGSKCMFFHIDWPSHYLVFEPHIQFYKREKTLLNFEIRPRFSSPKVCFTLSFILKIPNLWKAWNISCPHIHFYWWILYENFSVCVGERSWEQ